MLLIHLIAITLNNNSNNNNGTINMMMDIWQEEEHLLKMTSIMANKLMQVIYITNGMITTNKQMDMDSSSLINQRIIKTHSTQMNLTTIVITSKPLLTKIIQLNQHLQSSHKKHCSLQIKRLLWMFLSLLLRVALLLLSTNSITNISSTMMTITLHNNINKTNLINIIKTLNTITKKAWVIPRKHKILREQVVVYTTSQILNTMRFDLSKNTQNGSENKT